MKLIKYILISVIFAAGLAAYGCDGKNYADVSSNVKYVLADFYLGEYLGEKTKDSQDRLIKNAEVVYTKMNISPGGSMKIKGVSFDAVLKEKEWIATFYLKVYITNSSKALSVDEYRTENLLTDYPITVDGVERTVTVNFPAEYDYDLTGFDNSSNTYTLCIEFLDRLGEKNKTVKFSMNNVNLLT